MGEVGGLVSGVLVPLPLSLPFPFPFPCSAAPPLRRRSKGDLYIFPAGSVSDRPFVLPILVGLAVVGVPGIPALRLLGLVCCTAALVSLTGEAGGKGQAYMDIGIAWCNPFSRARFSRRRVSRGENTYMGGEDVRAQCAMEAMWFLGFSVASSKASECRSLTSEQGEYTA